MPVTHVSQLVNGCVLAGAAPVALGMFALEVTFLAVSTRAFLSHLPWEGLVREFTLRWLAEAFPDRHIMPAAFDFYRRAPNLWQ